MLLFLISSAALPFPYIYVYMYTAAVPHSQVNIHDQFHFVLAVHDGNKSVLKVYYKFGCRHNLSIFLFCQVLRSVASSEFGFDNLFMRWKNMKYVPVDDIFPKPILNSFQC